MSAHPQTQSDPEGGHPVRVVGGTWWLENLYQRAASLEITQTSEGFLLLQSITC
ncbi:MAG: hypothetical protein QOD89_1351 [Bradyrhizobium sp.]|jgi:hypothetical protein|nr:hypothetical protein [Bradyrhizobium sp.]